MYRADLDTRHKGGAVAAVAAIHAALALALLHLAGTVDLTDVQEGLRVFNVSEATPPPLEIPPPPVKPAEQQKAEKPAGGSEPNIKSEATPVVAPEPPIELPVTPKIAASETPREGVAPTQGAAPVPGSGTGSGGSGTGSGGGTGAGSGGGGGEGLAVVRTRLANRPLRGRDFPREVLDAWPRGAFVRMRLRIDPNGVPLQCIVDEGTGNSALDAQICAIARQKLRFHPGLNGKRQRVADWAGYGQEPPR